MAARKSYKRITKKTDAKAKTVKAKEKISDECEHMKEKVRSAKYREPGTPSRRTAKFPLDKTLLKNAIKKHEGCLSYIAEDLGCGRSAVREAINADQELKRDLENARERVVDEIECSAQDGARSSDPRRDTLKMFMLKTRRRETYEQRDEMLASALSDALGFVMDRSASPVKEK